ncbi:MAG: extracellular solute-binding protein [Deltaproteobacteria bacterium]|nr:extracellular solute-binding protein [Deltaproteobacteria bacterium]
MKKKTFLSVLAVILIVGIATSAALSEDLTRFKGKKLTVTCWSGAYANDFTKAYAEPFMKASGAVVIVQPGWSEFISKIKASPEDKPPYDVFLADGWNYIAAMNIKRLMPIRKENIPNAKDIYPELLKRDAWVKGYGVPFDGGLYLPVYDPGKIAFKPTGWKDLMRPELNGRLTMDQTFYYGLYAAAFISDYSPGIQELYSPEGLNACFKLSTEMAGKVKKFYKGGAEFFSLLKSGEADMGVYYSGGALSEKRKGMNIEILMPEEGVVAWIGYMTIMKGTKNQGLAEAFINFCLLPENQANFLKNQGAWVSNARTVIPDDIKSFIPSTDEQFKKITFFDWDLLNAKWGELEERWKKEVLTAVQ